MSARPSTAICIRESPKVSVFMTVYNAAPYLRAAVDSIVTQTFEDWELIVVENGSTDESPRILASYADQRIKVSWQSQNIGRTRALRHAFDLARGTYFAVLDADDVSHPERLAKQAAYLDEHSEVVLVGTWVRLIDEDGKALVDHPGWTPTTNARELLESLAWANPFVHSSAMYRGAVASEVGGYPDDLAHAQDGGLWLRLAQRGELAMIADYMCQYRVVSHGMTQAREYRAIVARDRLVLLRYARRHLNLGKDGLRRNRDEIVITEIKYGLAQIQGGSMIEGLFIIILAALRNPLSLLRNRVVHAQFINPIKTAFSRGAMQ